MRPPSPPRCPVALGLAFAAAVLPARAGAQTQSQANLIITVAAGVVTGGDLWTIARQPYCPVFAGGGCASPYDTLRLSRATSSSLMLGASVTYFPGPIVGFQGEMTYLGFPLSDACAVLNPGATRQSEQICGNIQGQSNTSGAISFFAGLVTRVTPRRAISPYMRAGVGLVAIDRSTVDVSGADSTGRVYGVLVDDSPRRLAVGGVVAAGITMPLGPGYQFRLEGRDVMSSLDRVAGAANASLRPPVDSGWFHHFALTLGLDIVLEQKRGRRY